MTSSMRFCQHNKQGEVAEWSKAHAWKVCELQKGSAGSNPALSARYKPLIIKKLKIKNCYTT